MQKSNPKTYFMEEKSMRIIDFNAVTRNSCLRPHFERLLQQ